MVKGKSDISNNAIRIFLQRVGEFYDKERGFDVFRPVKKQREEILRFFSSRCCYCNSEINIMSMSLDHIIPMNKASLGLHAWGNVAPCCRECNNKRHNKTWKTYLKSVCRKDEYNERCNRMETFIKKYNYNPNLNLKDVAKNLYQDIGEVSLTLIELRYRQAEGIIKDVIRKGK